MGRSGPTTRTGSSFLRNRTSIKIFTLNNTKEIPTKEDQLHGRIRLKASGHFENHLSSSIYQSNWFEMDKDKQDISLKDRIPNIGEVFKLNGTSYLKCVDIDGKTFVFESILVYKSSKYRGISYKNGCKISRFKLIQDLIKKNKLIKLDSTEEWDDIMLRLQNLLDS